MSSSFTRSATAAGMRSPDDTGTACRVHRLSGPCPPAEGRRGLGAKIGWRSWYDFFPWEDWRNGKPAILSQTIEPLLTEWAERTDVASIAQPAGAAQGDRLRIAFGMDGGGWDEEKVLERYELLYEAGFS